LAVAEQVDAPPPPELPPEALAPPLPVVPPMLELPPEPGLPDPPEPPVLVVPEPHAATRNTIQTLAMDGHLLLMTSTFLVLQSSTCLVSTRPQLRLI
jgi:hypothetical protein